MLTFLASLFVIASLLLNAYSVVKGPFLNVMQLIIIPYVYLVRPLTIISLGTTILYSKAFNMNNYKIGWLFASLCLFMSSFGYFVSFPRIRGLARSPENSKPSSFSMIGSRTRRVVVWAFILSMFCLSLMFAVTGTRFLPHNRQTAMSAVNPILRYLYPFVQLGAGVIAFYGILLILAEQKILGGVTWLIMSMIFTMIIYQRGITLGFATAAITIFVDYVRVKRKKINKKNLIKLLLLLMILFLLILFLRDIYSFIVTSTFYVNLNITNQVSEKGDFLDVIKLMLVSRPDGDIVEVWMILMNFLDEKGYQYGKTLLKIPFTLTSSNFRLTNNLKTGLDLINEYYSYEIYWYRKFGFNLNSNQELVMNFGIFGIFMCFFLGLLKGFLTSHFYHSLLRGKEVLLSYTVYSAINTFFGSFSGFQWAAFFLAYAYALKQASRVRISTIEKKRVSYTQAYYHITSRNMRNQG